MKEGKNKYKINFYLGNYHTARPANMHEVATPSAVNMNDKTFDDCTYQYKIKSWPAVARCIKMANADTGKGGTTEACKAYRWY